MRRSVVDLDIGKMSYLSGGKGENLILLHSLGVSAESWSKVIEPLSEKYSVFALDMFGHGNSDKPSQKLLIEDHAQSVIAFMDKLQIEKTLLCGNSVGALMSLDMTASNQARIEKLVLVGCPARTPWERMERLVLAAHGVDKEGEPLPFSMADLGLTLAHPTRELLDWFNSQRAKAGQWVKKTMISVALYDVFTRLPLILCPTLIVFGEKDGLREKADVFLQEIKGARSMVLKDAGHIPQIDKPDEFLREVLRFL